MPRLKLKVERREQRGPNAFLRLQLSEGDGPRSIPFEMTLHNVELRNVDVKSDGMCVITKEGAPVLVNFGKPGENVI